MGCGSSRAVQQANEEVRQVDVRSKGAPQPGTNGKVPSDNSSIEQATDGATAPASQPGPWVSPFAAVETGAAASRQSTDQADAQPQQQAANGPVHSLAWQEPPAQQQEQHAAAPQGPLMPQAGAEPILRAKSPFAQAASQRPSLDTAGGDKQYRGAVRPRNDEARVATLEHLDILDSSPDSRYDDITKLLCSIFRAPISQLSLVAKDRQWFKSVQGLEIKETDRNRAFCAWVLVPRFPEVLVIADTTADPRFKDNPQVTGPPFIRFYAGAPLIASNGHRLGSLCVADIKPRSLDAEQLALLCNFAEMVVREMEKDKLLQMERRGSQQDLILEKKGMERVAEAVHQGKMVVAMDDVGWRLEFANDVAASLAGQTRDQLRNRMFWDIFRLPPEAQGKPEQLYAATVQEGKEFTIAAVGAAQYNTVSLSFRPTTAETLDKHAPAVGIPSDVGFKGGAMRHQYFCFITTMTHSVLPTHTTPGTFRVSHAGRGQDALPFEDVRLGPLVGRGSFGKVYRGVWNGTLVAIKVIEHREELKVALETAGTNGATSTSTGTGRQDSRPPSPLLEAVLSLELSHPNIIKTYKYETRTVQAREGFDKSGPLSEPGSQPLPGYFALPGGSAAAGDRPFQTENAVLDQLHDSKNSGRTLETWLVLQYADKGSLQDAITKGWFRKVPTEEDSPVNVKHLLLTAREIAGAMSYLHDEDILHSDLTGGNILLGGSTKDERGYTALIADFGLSRQATGSSMETETYGTVTHMPPELLIEGKLTKSADVYAFGVVLTEMWTGQRPFANMRHAQIIYQVATHHEHPELPESAPQPLRDLAEACMHHDRHTRPNFEEVFDQLDEVMEQYENDNPAGDGVAQ